MEQYHLKFFIQKKKKQNFKVEDWNKDFYRKNEKVYDWRVPNCMKYLRKFFQQKASDMDESSISRKTLTVPEMGLGCSMYRIFDLNYSISLHAATKIGAVK